MCQHNIGIDGTGHPVINLGHVNDQDGIELTIFSQLVCSLCGDLTSLPDLPASACWLKPDFICSACLLRESGHADCLAENCLVCHVLRTEIERRLVIEICFREVTSIEAEFGARK